MQDTELYRYLLGIEAPWTVKKVQLDLVNQRVDVWADHAEDLRWPCPECGILVPLYDHAVERAWRHLDSCQFMTFLHARPPRINCQEHGVRQVRLPWAEAKARFTLLFERLAIDVLRESDILGATRILRISWDEAWHILERAVERGLMAKEKRICSRIGIDEKSVGKGHTYMTLVCDLDTSTVEYISEDRKQTSLDGYFEGLSYEQREGIEAVALDIWDPYIASVKVHVPQAEDKIVFDRYHLMTHMGKAVDDVRKKEHRALKQRGNETLTGSKYLWLYGEENLPEKHEQRFSVLKQMKLKTARAWAIKESLRDLWSYTRKGWASHHFTKWYFWATHSRLEPVIETAQMIHKYLHNVLTYFTHPITNAVAEGLNSKIQTIKKMAYGFRNREHFKTAIYFHCGGLQLYPVTHSIPG
jgi:transposase